VHSEPAPAWFLDLLGAAGAGDGTVVVCGGQDLVAVDGIFRSRRAYSPEQEQTADAFGYKWAKRDTFEGPEAMRRVESWLAERYGDVADAPWWDQHGPDPLVVDAGCGAGMSALALFGDRLERVRYLGVDVSTAVDVAARRFAEARRPGAFLQADLSDIPLPSGSVDVILSEGVLHHTDSTEDALGRCADLLAPGGRILFYVYRRKGPIREFTDDHIRAALQDMAPDEGWEALLPLTKLGKVLGDLQVVIDVPEDVDLLGIPAGPIDLQRLVYWHVCKMFHAPGLRLEELNHINYDWFAPANAHRQSIDEVQAWCAAAQLVIEREVVEDAGITIIARKAS
jgi:arsenite methyltransferase